MPEHLQILVNSFVVGLSGAMMPGPLFALVVARTPKEGLSTGTLMAVGHSILELFMVIALSFGLALFVRESPTVSRVIAILGGVGLLYMAYGMFTSLRQHDGPVSKSSFAARDGKSSTSQLIGMGIATTISSPFWFMWWIMVGSALLLSSMKAGYGGPPAFYVGHIFSDLIWYSLVTILVWQGRRVLTGIGYKLLIGGCAAFLVWLGYFFIKAGWTNAINQTFN